MLHVTCYMRLHPLSDHIVLEPAKEEEKTKSGILLPDTAEKDEIKQGKVVAAGPGRKTAKGTIPIDVKVGDKVLYSKYSPDKVKVDEKEYIIVKEEDILAVLE